MISPDPGLVPSLINDVRENVRLFNEDEAVWRCFKKKQKRRRRQKHPPPRLRKLLEDFDWRMAEREARPVRATGKWIDP